MPDFILCQAERSAQVQRAQIRGDPESDSTQSETRTDDPEATVENIRPTDGSRHSFHHGKKRWTSDDQPNEQPRCSKTSGDQERSLPPKLARNRRDEKRRDDRSKGSAAVSERHSTRPLIWRQRFRRGSQCAGKRGTLPEAQHGAGSSKT